MKTKKPTSNKYKERRKLKAALSPKYNKIQNRSEELYVDYLDKLSEEEKDWLNRFNEEYVNANFKHGGKVLHKTKAQKREIYAKNNSRNRCILNRYKETYVELADKRIKDKV